MMEVPQRHDVVVQTFCRKNGFRKPFRLDVRPVPSARLSSCHYNVKAHVEQNGGNAQYGWIIWRASSLFLEAEHHCVWRSPNGALVDITPKARGEEAVLFAPDPRHPFDFVGLRYQLNRYQNLSGGYVVDALIATALERQKLMTAKVLLVNGELNADYDVNEAETLRVRMTQLLTIAIQED